MSTTNPDDFDALRVIVQALQPFETKDQERILRWVSEKMGLSAVSLPGKILEAPTPAPGTPLVPMQPGRSSDIRTFVASKNPTGLHPVWLTPT